MSELIRFKFQNTVLRTNNIRIKNPALIFVLSFAAILIVISFIYFDQFVFSEFKVFTFFWTYILLLFIHSLLNFRYCWNSILDRKPDNILKMLHFITTQYFPYLLIALIYDNLNLFIDLFSDRFKNIDILLMNMDQRLLGVQPTVWLENFLHPAAVDFFMLAYSMFFIYPFFFLIYLLQKNHIELFHRLMFAQILALIVSLVSFIIFPATGPRFTILQISEFSADGLNLYRQKLAGISCAVINQLTGHDSLYAVQYDLWNYIERVTTDCMPSMHTGLCLICLIYALRFRKIFKYEKLAVWFWITGVTALIISTVYLRYHWVVDVIAGATLAFAVYLFTELFWKFRTKNKNKSGAEKITFPWTITTSKTGSIEA